MSRLSLGEHSKITVAPAERQRLQKFYRDVLGCKVITKAPAADLIQVAPNFYIGVNYDEAALKESDVQKAIWLELRTDDPEALKEKIVGFGIKRIEFWDKEHFYFQAPGGQVFRLVDTTEDMSKWER